jgi:uncharacterized repeat protein (TIGR01451 family)
MTADQALTQPGQVLTYTLTYSNIGDRMAYEVVVTDKVPPNTRYLPNSAAGLGTHPAFSHDNGETFDASQAPPVTHLRWTRIHPLPGGKSGSVRYQVRVE